jgi:hypothetical protein
MSSDRCPGHLTSSDELFHLGDESNSQTKHKSVSTFKIMVSLPFWASKILSNP